MTSSSTDVASGAIVPPDLAALAARHGLRVSGARPSPFGYARQLWSRRHFIVAFANARLAAGYANARLGRLWQVFTPLVNAAVYFLIFGIILNTRKGVDNFVAYLCIGIFVFTFTQKAVLAGTRSFADNLGLIRALHFPRASLPIAFTIGQLQQMAFSMLVMLGIVLVTGEPITLRWPLVVPVLALQTVFNVGLAMFMARVGSKSSDVVQIMPFVMRTWMYASGVFYSVTTISANAPAAIAFILESNPLLIYIDLMRHALLTDTPLVAGTTELWLLGVGWAVFAGVVGYLFCWQAEEEYGRG